MNIVLFLIAFPVLIALLTFIARGRVMLRIIVLFATAALCAAPVSLLFFDAAHISPGFALPEKAVGGVMFAIEVLLAVYVFIKSVRVRKYVSAFLIAAQSAIMFPFHLLYGSRIRVNENLFVDNLSVIMALIIGIIGSLICLYAVGYMHDYHEIHHRDVKNRRGLFFFLMYVFLSAMFGIVFCNNLMWVYFFWEITTICSFLLIQYKGDKDSVDSSYLAINMNLLGGISFACGIIYLYYSSGIMGLSEMLALGRPYALIPAACIIFAGIIKSAQMPFSRWLLGAMVAPTPVSALLHSSTMVKAGVYIILKASPVFQGTNAGLMLSFLGATTFLIAAFIAISQSNAKRVLAYSTISNLGLIVACAGINTHEAIWSAILLIIFHALAKSLLFLCVGITDNKLGARDIEEMDFLIMRMPKLAAVMMIGISGMFLAPFGMLISKWVTLKAFIDYNPVLSVIIAYGSAATLFFWTKWMGKIIQIKHDDHLHSIDEHISMWEWITLGVVAFLTISVCVAFPLVSSRLIEPFIVSLYGISPTIDRFSMTIIVIIMVGLLIILPMGILYYAFVDKEYKRVGTYLGGANMTNTTFEGAMLERQRLTFRNYYMENLFGEKKLFVTGMVLAAIFIIIMFGVAAA